MDHKLIQFLYLLPFGGELSLLIDSGLQQFLADPPGSKPEMKVLACGFNGMKKFVEEENIESFTNDQYLPNFIVPYWESTVADWDSERTTVVSSLEDTLLLDGCSFDTVSFGGMSHEMSCTSVRAVERMGILWCIGDAENVVSVSNDEGTTLCKAKLPEKVGPLVKVAGPITCLEGQRYDQFVVFLMDMNGQVFRFEITDSAEYCEQLQFDEPVADVAAGREHVVLLTRGGAVYSCGLSSRGQLGLGSLNAVKEPQKIQEVNFGQKITQITAGGWASMALNSGGVVFVWGWNSAGALGLPSRSVREKNSPKLTAEDDFVEVLAEPAVLNLEEEIVWISCGMRHAGALTRTGSVYMWGLNQHGQLGLGDYVDRDVPVLVELKCPLGWTMSRLFCGEWTTLLLLAESKLDERSVAAV